MSIFQKPLHKLFTNYTACSSSKRTLFGILRIAFNAVDQDRLRQVGPDRLCAEWILKNGGVVRFTGKGIVSDYNTLPAQNQFVRIKEVDASGASIMSIGFDHFKNCEQINRIVLHECKHMENEALQKLEVIKDTLTSLQVTDCPNVTDNGLKALGQLVNLEELVVSGVPYVENLKTVTEELQEKLPNCKINISP